METEGLTFTRTGNKEWEFQYIDKDWEGKYYPFPADSTVSVVEFKDKTLLYMDNRDRPLMKLNNFTLYEQYIACSINSLQRETYLKSEVPVITEKMREKGIIKRYFVRDKFDNNIFEVSKEGFINAGVFYNRVSFQWSLQKTKSNVRSYNLNSLINASFVIPRILRTVNPLQFYVEELTPEEIKLKKMGELIKQDGYSYVHGHNPHSHPLEHMVIDEENNQPMVTIPISRISTTTTGRTRY